MDTKVSSIDDVIETASAEQANQLRNRGWFLLAIGKGHDNNGEACLKYSLGLKRATTSPLERQGSNDSSMDAVVADTLAQKVS
jgi:hypothetical protein